MTRMDKNTWEKHERTRNDFRMKRKEEINIVAGDYSYESNLDQFVSFR